MKEFIVKSPKFSSSIDFEKLSPRAIKDMLTLDPVPFTPGMKKFAVLFDGLVYGMSIAHDTTWINVKDSILQTVWEELESPLEIIDIGLSNRSLYSEDMEVLNMTGASPYELIPNWSMVHLAMIQKSQGWIPLNVLCYQCGTCNSIQLRKNTTLVHNSKRYCSRECLDASQKHAPPASR